MFFPRLFLVLLVFAAPVTVVVDGPIIYGLVAAVAAISIATIAMKIRPGEAGFLAAVIRPIAYVAAVPAIWMMIQVMPLQTFGLAHSVWKSAAAALGHPLAGAISIDPGATLIALMRYLSTIAIALIAAAVAIDRQRAEWALFALMASTTLVAMMALATKFGVFTFLTSGNNREQSDFLATAIAGLGIILSSAAALHTIEQREMSHPKQIRSDRGWLAFSACLVAFAICCLATLIVATSQTYFAVGCGIATLVVATMIRRFDIGAWGIAGIISTALFIAIAVTATQLNNQSVDLSLAFATQAPMPLIAITQRILTESGWAGTGAGTFAYILPIFRDMEELTSGQIAPTAAATIAVEMGRPFFWATLLAMVTLALTLLSGALRRHRNSFYPTAGASCVVVVALLAFGNSAPLATSVSIIAATAIGMAIAQRKSRLI